MTGQKYFYSPPKTGELQSKNRHKNAKEAKAEYLKSCISSRELWRGGLSIRMPRWIWGQSRAHSSAAVFATFEKSFSLIFLKTVQISAKRYRPALWGIYPQPPRLTSKKHMTGFLEIYFGGFCRSMVLMVSCCLPLVLKKAV